MGLSAGELTLGGGGGGVIYGKEKRQVRRPT